jgi:hypothetical protein
MQSTFSRTHHKLRHRTATNAAAYVETEARMLVKFSKNAQCLKLPLSNDNCGDTCLSGDKHHKLFYVFHTERSNTYLYNFMIHYDDSAKQVVVSFGGPNLKKHPNYMDELYSHGLVGKDKTLKGGKVEKEYSFVYFEKVRSVLHQKLAKISESGRKDYVYLFNGHSIGGSIATLAALDAVLNGVIQENKLKES